MSSENKKSSRIPQPIIHALGQHLESEYARCNGTRQRRRRARRIFRCNLCGARSRAYVYLLDAAKVGGEKVFALAPGLRVRVYAFDVGKVFFYTFVLVD